MTEAEVPRDGDTGRLIVFVGEGGPVGEVAERGAAAVENEQEGGHEGRQTRPFSSRVGGHLALRYDSLSCCRFSPLSRTDWQELGWAGFTTGGVRSTSGARDRPLRSPSRRYPAALFWARPPACLPVLYRVHNLSCSEHFFDDAFRIRLVIHCTLV